MKYGNIKKVYSIWICSNTADIRANSVDKYTIDRKTIMGSNEDNPRYDIINAIIVNIGNKHDPKDSDSRMMRMLNHLLDKILDKNEKLKVHTDCGIAVKREIDTEVTSMCTYTTSVLQEGMEKGMERGQLQKGITVYNNLIKRGFSKEEALSIAEIPESAIKSEDKGD